MEELIYAEGSSLVDTVHQRRSQPDPQYHLGTGKLEEARHRMHEAGATLVVVNAALKPNQIFNLQQFFAGNYDGLDPGRLGSRVEGRAEKTSNRTRDKTSAHDIEVWDRTRLILEIFRERARSPEARLQVELAQLTYETPLVKETIHLAKKGEHPGFLGGGEYEVNQYYDMMKKRMVRIRRDLEKMRRERGLRRKHRRRGGYHLVSLAGYTNAGKSSLLRALAPAPTLVENRYFSTLSTKTRRAASDKRDILVTDTVGFIEDLPPWLVEAFHSTLEEIAFSDVTLLVLDASDPIEEMARRLRSSLRILWTFDADQQTPKMGMAHAPAAHGSAAHAQRSTTLDGAAAAGAEEGGQTFTTRPQAGSQMDEGTDGAPDDPSPTSKQAPGIVGAGVAGAAESSAELADSPTARLAARMGGTPVATGGGAGPVTRGAAVASGEDGMLAPILVVLNKMDRVTPGDLEAKAAKLVEDGLLAPDGWIAVSALENEGLDALFERLYTLLPAYDLYEVAIPQTPETESFLAWLHDEADVLSLTRGNEVHVRFEAKISLAQTMRERLVELKAVKLELGDTLTGTRRQIGDEASDQDADQSDGFADTDPDPSTLT